jgi:hypothetical protein
VWPAHTVDTCQECKETLSDSVMVSYVAKIYY